MLYQSIGHRAGLKLSHHLPNCTMSDHFPVFFLGLFFVNCELNFGTSEPVNSNRRLNQTKVCKHVERRNFRYQNVSRDENPQRENEIESPSFEDFLVRKKHSYNLYSKFSFALNNRTKQEL